MVRARKYILERYFKGFPKKSDFKLIEEELPHLKHGEFLAKAVYLSVDPYMRAYARPSMVQLGTTFIGSQVAKIVDTTTPKYPVGGYVVGNFGWRDFTVSTGDPDFSGQPPLLLPDLEGLPLSLGVGALGMPGNTAYFGFLDICQPKAGETVVVTGAAGAVGSLVGQIAKIKGCKAIGIAGSDEKGKWLLDELGFDEFINYKNEDFAGCLRKAAPEGIDCYFDNVGGRISSVILKQMNPFGRVSVCGAISIYNMTDEPLAPVVQPAIVARQLRMEGFVYSRFNHKWLEGLLQMKKWIKEGKIKYRETVTYGFENMVEAFVDMLKGGNYGKAVVKVQEQSAL